MPQRPTRIHSRVWVLRLASLVGTINSNRAPVSPYLSIGSFPKQPHERIAARYVPVRKVAQVQWRCAWEWRWRRRLGFSARSRGGIILKATFAVGTSGKSSTLVKTTSSKRRVRREPIVGRCAIKPIGRLAKRATAAVPKRGRGRHVGHWTMWGWCCVRVEHRALVVNEGIRCVDAALLGDHRRAWVDKGRRDRRRAVSVRMRVGPHKLVSAREPSAWSCRRHLALAVVCDRHILRGYDFFRRRCGIGVRLRSLHLFR